MKKIILLIIVIGSLMMALPLAGKSGFDKKGNLVGISYSDDFMHVAFARELANHFPPQHPLFAGDRLTNYHYGTDIIAAFLNRISGISPLTIHFKIMPLVYVVLLGFSAWWLAKNLKLSSSATVIFLLFTYFGSSFSFMADLAVSKQLSWDDAFGIGQPSGYAFNQPLLFSLSLWLVVLSLLVVWDKKPSWSKGVILSVLVGSLMIVKVLAGLMAYVALFTALAVYPGKKQWLKFGKMSVMIFLAAIISVFIVKLVADDPGGLVWAPLIPVSRFIESPNFEEISNDIVLRMYQYLQAGNKLRIALIYFLAIIIFFVGNLGSRIFGLVVELSKRRGKQFGVTGWILLVSAVAAGVIPLFAILKTGGFNSGQLFLYMLVLLNIPASVGWARILVWRRTKHWLVLSGILFLLLLLPGSLGSFVQAMSGRQTSLDAGVVRDLEDLGDILDRDAVILLDRELVLEQQNYVSALTGRRVYLEGVEYSRIQGHKVDERLGVLNLGLGQFYDGKNIDLVRKTLNNENIEAVVLSYRHILPADTVYKPWRSNNQFQIYLFLEK